MKNRSQTRRGRTSKNTFASNGATPFESLETRQLMTAVNPVVIDLFMAYTSTARAEVGSQALMVDKINRAVSYLNEELANSKVNAAVRLVGTMETTYTETGNGSTDLDRLSNPSDGQLDEVTAAAAAAGADVTDLVAKQLDVGGITQGNFNVDQLRFLDNGVFSHEFGHTLGGDHQHGVDGTHAIADAYEGTLNFGGTNYSGVIGGALPYFSNPNVMFRGQPTGVDGTGDNAANNARVMNTNVAAVSAATKQVIADTTGPTVRLATVSTPTGQNGITFNVRFGDGSGVNVDSLGDNNFVVTGPNGFSAPAKLVSVDDPSVNYAYHVATYQVATSAPVSDVSAYTFTLQANTVSDTAGNFAAAGAITAASTPLLPVYGDTDAYLSSEEGDVTGKTLVISNEIGKKYQNAFITNPTNRFSLSAASTLVLNSSSPNFYRPQLYRDTNGNLQIEQSERIAPSGAGTYANLPAGDNYYLVTQVYSGGPDFADYQLSASFSSPGSTQVKPSSLTGIVFTDPNNNGIQEAGELGTAGIPVSITGNDYLGKPVNVTVNTDANGVFTFTGLNPSDNNNGYTLTEKLPSSIQPLKGVAGSIGGTPFGNGVIRYITVAPGSTGTDYRFGNAAQIPSAPLSGSVYFDKNNNGFRDPFEPGLAGVQINVFGQGQDNINYSTTVKTDADGNYITENLAPGIYTLREIQPNGVIDGIDRPGTLGGDLSVKNWIQSIQVPGFAGTGYNFGEQSLPANPPAPPTTTDQTTTTPQGTPTGGNVVTAPVNITPVFDFSNGFINPAGRITYNGSATPVGNSAQLVPQQGSVAGGIYYSAPVNITKWNTQFSFNTTAGGGTADGMTFVIQNNTVKTLGAVGGGLGYQGIGKSIAIKFDLWNNSGEGSNSTGLYIDGAAPDNVGSVDLTPSGIDLHNGNTIQVAMSYDGATLKVTLTDPTTGKTATQSYTVDIAATVGGNTAFVGFTAGTGGATTAATVSGWTFAAQAATAGRSAMAVPAAQTVYAELIPGSGPAHAQSFKLNRDGSYTYVPVASFVGTDTFSFQVVDANGRIAQAKVNLIVTHVNQVPKVQTEMMHTTYVSQGSTIDLDLDEQMTDSESTPMTFKLGKVTGGTAKLLSDGHTVRFTASSTFVGNAVINYGCSDGMMLSYTSTSVCVLAVPKKPAAMNDSAITLPSTSVNINALKNDQDPNNVHLCISNVAAAAHGKTYIDTRGTSNPADDVIVYRPNFGFHGTDTFKYTIVDFYGTPATASISVTVNPGAGIGVDPSNASLTALDIYGTSGNDTITIAKNNNAIAVKMNGILLGNFNPTGLIAAFGGDGNDTIDAHGLSKTVALFGDAGKDKLTGGASKSLLVGGAGEDVLTTGAGVSYSITGSADYATKGFAPLVGVFNNATSLSGYVHDDGVVDQVYAGSGKDTFWATVTGKGKFDVLHDRLVGENVFALS